MMDRLRRIGGWMGGLTDGQMGWMGIWIDRWRLDGCLDG